jgi:NTE family protein
MKRIIVSILIAFSLLSTAAAQKVGLVLSGGGAKGLAHIAVIRALEENGIPIDYIAGTSMGAIVAGLYASGYSPDEMERLFKSDQFKFWSTGMIQEEYRYFYSQSEEDPSWLELGFQKKAAKFRMVTPTNLVPEEQMDFAFMELFSAVNAIDKGDFNKLFVPFFCIATDIYNNRKMVLRQGDLGEAIRASMTFPFYFKPIEIDGSLVFDGGIINNFPVQDTKELFDPDVIIGHNVSNNPEKPDPDDIMAQIENMIMKKTDYAIAPQDGIFMETSFDDIGLLDFKKIDQIEIAGKATINKMMDTIKKRISRRVRPSEIQEKRRQFNMKKPELNFQNIQVEGVEDDMKRQYIVRSLKPHSKIIDLPEFKKEYFKLIADPQIKSLRPVARYNPETGYFDLRMIVKHSNPLQVKFGANVSTRPINQGFLSGDYHIFNKRSYSLSTNMYFGRFYASLKVGARIDYPTRLPFYLAGYYTLNHWNYYSSTTEFVFEDVRPPYVIQNESNFRLEVGIPLNTWGKFTLGGAWSDARDKYYLSESIKATDTADLTYFDAGSFSANFLSNTFNDKQYPTEGIASCLSANYVIGEEENVPGSTSNSTVPQDFNHNFYLLKANFDRYVKLNHLFSLGLMAEGVYCNKKPFSNYMATVLSAPTFNPMPHSKTIFIEGFHANKYLAGGVKGIIQLSGSLHFRAEVYGFSPYNEIQETTNHIATFDTKHFSTIKFMGTGALVFQSAIGPVSLSLNYYDKNQTKFFAMLNIGYIIFNKRGY